VAGGNQQQIFPRRRRAMKTNLVRMAVLAVVAAFTMAGSALAGDGEAARVFTPDPNDWQYQGAMETGNLPSRLITSKKGSGSAADFPSVEYGGVVYRIAIDTP
jgi:hypothetical protein